MCGMHHHAWLQVVHSVVRLVPSSVFTTLMQVYSRLSVTWLLIEGVAGVNENVGLLIVAYAWGITEVIRYAYYFFSLLNYIPYSLAWCRYASNLKMPLTYNVSYIGTHSSIYCIHLEC